MSDPEAALVWCPFPDMESARKVAGQLLAEKLIACANILPQVVSVFEYEGKACAEEEAAVIFKTGADRLEALTLRLGECHPYDTPAIVGWRCDAAHPVTQGWLGEVLGSVTP
jgi:periplasmic divalent cation tolerance protein